MPFEDFYKAEDERSRRWWKCVGAAFLLYIGYWSFALILAPDSKSVERARNNDLETANEILVSSALNRVDNQKLKRLKHLCSSLPKPEKFIFNDSSEPQSDGNKTQLIYRYSSTRRPDEIMPIFLMWFNDNGWKRIFQTETFRKNNQTVFVIVIQNPNFTHFSYDIYCSEDD